ncbi:MAG TPA: RNA polymerase sigma factor [Syntrophales bacterium]|jgi:RNA polymerase sigma-70 factor (ECF subfamily)|nr:RNA polymerase sigma factor [Syntrophales bacterium]
MDWKEQNEIISRVLGGDRNAYTQVVNRYKGPIFNLAYRMTGSYHDADDLTQETFLKAFTALRKFQGEKKFFTWLYTIGLNLIRNHLKGAKPAAEPMEALCNSEPRSEFENPEDCAIRGEERRLLDLCVRRLSPDIREAVVLRFHQGLSFEDIAAVSGCTLSGAKMKVYRGLEKLRSLMDETTREKQSP